MEKCQTHGRVDTPPPCSSIHRPLLRVPRLHVADLHPVRGPRVTRFRLVVCLCPWPVCLPAQESDRCSASATGRIAKSIFLCVERERRRACYLFCNCDALDCEDSVWNVIECLAHSTLEWDRCAVLVLCGHRCPLLWVGVLHGFSSLDADKGSNPISIVCPGCNYFVLDGTPSSSFASM